MKTVNMRVARETFADLIDQAQTEPVMLTKHGKPVGVLLGAGQADLLQKLLGVTQPKARKARA